MVALAEDPEVRLQIAAIDMGSDNINDYDPRTKTFTSPDQAKPWSHDFHRQFFQICRDLKLRPYLGVYEPGALRSIAKYLEMGWLEPPLVMKFFFSDAGPYGFPPNPRCVEMFVRTLELVFPGVPKIWFTMCYGHSIWDLVRPTIELGGHVRVGLGQYHPWYWHDPTGDEPTNAEQVARVADIARSMGRGLATPAEARAAFGLPAWSGAPGCGRAFPLRRRGGALIMAGRKLIIEAALHEFVPKSTNPHIPYGPDEVAADTASCIAAGLSFLHFHARDGETGAQLGPIRNPTRNRSWRCAAGVFRPIFPGTRPMAVSTCRPSPHAALAADPEIRLAMAAIDVGTDNSTISIPRRGSSSIPIRSRRCPMRRRKICLIFAAS